MKFFGLFHEILPASVTIDIVFHDCSALQAWNIFLLWGFRPLT